jgi:beta-glucosidase
VVEFEQQPGKIWHGQRSGLACDWWRNAEVDFDLMQQLGLNAHRMSVEWSRIEPEPGRFDPAAIDRYREMLDGLRRRGMEPMVTLHHFTNRSGWSAAAAGRRQRSFPTSSVMCGMWCRRWAICAPFG